MYKVNRFSCILLLAVEYLFNGFDKMSIKTKVSNDILLKGLVYLLEKVFSRIPRLKISR